jgi:GntR family transcriptional repressor for pyruvate dehydrogenase complex
MWTAVRKDAGESHLLFHMTILRAAKLPALEVMLRPLQEFIVISSTPPVLEQPEFWEVDAHDVICQALESGDPVAAEAAMCAHFRYTEAPE